MTAAPLQKTMTPLALVLMGLLGLIWGASFLSNRIALTEVGVLTVVAFRVGGAAAVLWLWLWARGVRLPRGGRIWLAFLGIGITNNALPFTLITWGQTSIESGLAAILNASTAIFAVLAAALALRDERLTRARAAGVATGFAGVVTVIGPAALTTLDPTSMGQLAMIGAAMSYAVSGVLIRLVFRGQPPEVVTAGVLTGASLVMIPLALMREGLPSPHHSAQVWAALAYLAAVSTAIAYLIYYRLIALAGAGNTGFVTLLVAPVAIVLGAIVFHEALPLRAFAGFALLAAGLAILDGRLLARDRGAASGKAPG